MKLKIYKVIDDYDEDFIKKEQIPKTKKFKKNDNLKHIKTFKMKTLRDVNN